MSAAAIEAGRAYVTVAVKGTKESVNDLTGMVDKMKGKLSSGDIKGALMGGLAGGVAGVVANVLSQVAGAIGKVITGVVNSIKTSLDLIWQYSEGISNVVKMADRLGTSVGFISSMRTVMEDSGATMADFESSMKAFQRNMFTAGTGVGEAKGAFEQLGLDPKELSMQDLYVALLKVVHATKQLGSSSEVAGVMMRIMGENASKMIPFLQGNTELFQTLIDQSNYLGRSLDEEGARGVDNMRDSWVKLGRQLDAIWEQFVINIAPAISYIIDGGLIPLIKTIGDMVASFGRANTTAKVFGLQYSIMAKMLVMVGINAARVAQIVAKMTASFLTSIHTLIKLHGLLTPMGRLKPFQNMERNIGGMARELRSFERSLDAGLDNFWPQFIKNQAEWKKMTEEERKLTKNVNDNFAEDVTAAANKIADVFGGDAMQRNASTMQKMQEMSLKNSTDIKDYVKKIHQSLIAAPVVRGTL